MRLLKTLLFTACFLLGVSWITAQTNVQCIDDATISFYGGGTEDQLLCDQTGDPIRFRFTTSSLAMPFGFLVVDTDGTIVHAGLSGRIDFSTLPPGDYRVYAFSWLGQFKAEAGQNIADAELASICYALTTNFIRINTAGAVGGTVQTEDGLTEVYTCPGDGNSDIVSFDSLGTSDTDFIYVITNDNGIVLAVTTEDSFDFETAGMGICRVYGLAYTGDLMIAAGDILTGDFSDGCFGLSDNFISVIRRVPEGGTVAMPNGETERLICPGNGIADVVMFDSSGTSSTPYTYLITDENNIILGIPSGDSNDFDGAGVGNCRVWGLAYTGTITAVVGDDAASVALTDDCFDLSDNFITIIREVPDAGTVTTEEGETEINTCPGDGIADVVSFVSTGATMNTSFTYVITDENNIILGLPTGNSNDFDGAGTGNCRVWALAYTGTLTAQVGDDVTAVTLSDDCFDLSDNFINVIRQLPEGGTVSMPNGATERLVCPGDGVADVVMFDSSGTGVSSYVYVITDDQNVVLSVATGDSQDFDGAGTGACRVWGLAYTGTLTVTAGDDITAVDLSDACYDLSDNFITIIRETPEGGVVTTEDGATTVNTCPSDGMADIIRFDSAGTSTNTPYVYVITDDQNIILGFADGDSQNFDGAGTGACRVWGLAYTGQLTAQAGDDAAAVALSDDCFDLSDNFITVIREVPEAGTVWTIDNMNQVFLCPGDGIPDIVTFMNDGASNTSYAYVLVNSQAIVLGVVDGDTHDFDGAGVGDCLVFGVAYTGNLTVMPGDDIANAALSDDCFDLSDNFVNVTRQNAEGGSIALEDGTTEALICPNDGNPDLLRFDSTGTSPTDYAYVVTDDQNIIIVWLDGDSNNFDGAGVGTCRVWGVAYTGNITAAPGDVLGEEDLSDACYDLSDNFITVVREEADGGTVATPAGETLVYTCPDDGNPDVVLFSHTTESENTPYIYLVTNEENVILGIVTGDQLDFDGAGPGNCRVYGLSITGALTVEVGSDIDTEEISDDCYELSANFISVIREVPNGGMITSNNGTDEINTCPGDGISDLVSFDSTGTSNTPYVYVVTDADNMILAILDGDSNDFEGAGTGACRVWGLAYTGNLTIMPGDNFLDVMQSDDCARPSDNFITVNRDNPEAGMILLEDSTTDTVVICPMNGNPDILRFDSTGANQADYVYLITDTAKVIIGIADGDSQDFDGAPAGICRVWGLAYTGGLIFTPGEDADEVDLSDGCYDLTDNFLTVIRQVPDGGMITDGNGETVVNICAGDGVADVVEFVVDNPSMSDLAYLVTDQDGFLIGILTEDNFDFDNSSPGDWRIYGVAYTGSLLPFPGDNIFDVDLSDDCFDLTDNFIALNKSNIDGGTIFAAGDDDLVYVCAEDGFPDVVTFVNNSIAIDADYTYVLTTESNTVLSVVPGDNVNFETTGFDRLRVYGISSTGTLSVEPGDDITTTVLSDSCYALSDNFVTVVRDLPVSGEVSLEDGSTDVLLCIGGESGELTVTNNSPSNAGYLYVVTDEDNVIVDIVEDLPIDFSQYAPGFYRVWGVSYTGQIIGEVGDNILVNDITNSCFDLTPNFITVERSETLDGGTLDNELGGMTVYTCPGDDMSDLIAVTTTSQDTGYFFVLTDTSGNVLIPRIDDDNGVIDFDLAAPGVCRVYGVSMVGETQIIFGTNLFTDPLSTYCAALSDNFITIVRQLPEGGTISTDEGETEVTVVVGDDEEDIITFTNTGANLAPYVYVVTDEDNKVIDFKEDVDFVDFEGAGPGVCRVWGLSFTGVLSLEVGDDITTDTLSNDCYDLSDNFVTVNRIENFQDGGFPTALNGALTIQSVALAPNPVHGDLQVQYVLQQEVAAPTTLFRILSVEGQTVLLENRAAMPGSNNPSFDLSQLPAGMYLLQIRNGDALQSVRFVKD